MWPKLIDKRKLNEFESIKNYAFLFIEIVLKETASYSNVNLVMFNFSDICIDTTHYLYCSN